MRWLRRHYGAGPLHLLTLVACFALAGYATSRLVISGPPEKAVVWFLVAIVGHDLVLWPLYALADRSAVRLARRRPERLPRVPWVNHVRVPVVICVALLTVSFPLVLRMSEPAYHAATGLTEAPFLDRFLLVVGVVFAASALLYAVRLGAAGRRVSAAPPTCRGPSGSSPSPSP